MNPHRAARKPDCLDAVHDPDATLPLAEQLVAWFDQPQYAIAFSGGVDSAVVCQAAVLSGKQAVAYTAESPSVARREVMDASQVAQAIGIPHEFIETHEIEDEAYAQNDQRRCYHCKSHLFATMHRVCGSAVLVTGTNADDLGDYRPGLQAANEAAVRAPLAELGIGKEGVRELARLWGLRIAEKPASPCLASRLAYGVAVTPERLRQVEQAEAWLRAAGIQDCRVRLHPDDLVRIEVPTEHIAQLASDSFRQALVYNLRQLGFRFIALDLEGFRSGSLNQVVPLKLKQSTSSR